MAVPVLKARHSLVGKNPFPVANLLRGADTQPVVLARLKKEHPLERYTHDQCRQEFEGLVGCPVADVLSAATKEDTHANVRMALHFAIMEANTRGQPKAQVPVIDLVGQGSNKEKTADLERVATPPPGSSRKTGEDQVVSSNFFSVLI